MKAYAWQYLLLIQDEKEEMDTSVVGTGQMLIRAWISPLPGPLKIMEWVYIKGNVNHI